MTLEHLAVVFFAALCIGVALAMLLATTFFGPKRSTPEKRMPYESGADSSGAGSLRLGVKFYLTAILFVVFDIEVIFLYPWVSLFPEATWAMLLQMGAFIVLLGGTLLYAWKKGALEWEK